MDGTVLKLGSRLVWGGMLIALSGCLSATLDLDRDDEAPGDGGITADRRMSDGPLDASATDATAGPDARAPQGRTDARIDDGDADVIGLDARIFAPDARIDPPVDAQVIQDRAPPPPDAAPECRAGETQDCANDCGPGERTCEGDGRFGPCVVNGMAEICNGRDDDCDGIIDNVERIGDPCSAGVGACRADGMWVCGQRPNWGLICSAIPDDPEPETCNGADDDCNGTTDEGFDVGQACTSGVGACAQAGQIECTGRGRAGCNAPEGLPSAEVCNLVDDDCDGAVDEGDLCPSGPQQVGVCAAGACAFECEPNWIDWDENPGNGCERGCDPLAGRNLIDDRAPADADASIVSAANPFLVGHIQDERIVANTGAGPLAWAAQSGFTNLRLAMGAGRFFGTASDNRNRLWMLELNDAGAVTTAVRGPEFGIHGPVAIGANDAGESFGVRPISLGIPAGNGVMDTLEMGRASDRGVVQFGTVAVDNLDGTVRPAVAPWINQSWLVVLVTRQNGMDVLRALIVDRFLQILDQGTIPGIAEINSIAIGYRNTGAGQVPDTLVVAIAEGNRMISVHPSVFNGSLSLPGSNNQIAPNGVYGPELSVLETGNSEWAVLFPGPGNAGQAWLYDDNRVLPVRPNLGAAPRIQATGDGRTHHAVLQQGGELYHVPVRCE